MEDFLQMLAEIPEAVSESVRSRERRNAKAHRLIAPPPAGTPLLVSLALAFEHTGVYLGGNRVVAASALNMAGDKAAQLGVHKYSLRAESPVLGMGDASVFAATDVDFAGNLRLRNGKLDPGCFQCWLNILGTYLIMR